MEVTPPAVVGPLVTVGHPLCDPQAKEEAGFRYGAIAVDMETAAVAQAADLTDVPWMALRVILDPMEVRLSGGSWIQGFGLFALPSRWRELVGFIKAIRMAGRSLASGLEGAGHRLKEKIDGFG